MHSAASNSKSVTGSFMSTYMIKSRYDNVSGLPCLSSTLFIDGDPICFPVQGYTLTTDDSLKAMLGFKVLKLLLWHNIQRCLYFIMLGLVAWIHCLIIGLEYWTSYPLCIMLVGPAANTFMLLIIITRFDIAYAWSRIKCGQVLPMYLYLGWMILFPQKEVLYTIPVLLSSLGKIYLLCTSPHILEVDTVEQFIVLQAKVQAVVFLHHFLLFLCERSQGRLIQLCLLVLILKLKHTIHYGTRKAYEQIHFGLDHLFKAMKMRGFYHFIQYPVSQLACGAQKNNKQISY